jgi:hypothetical protein
MTPEVMGKLSEKRCACVVTTQAQQTLDHPSLSRESIRRDSHRARYWS